MNEPTLSDQLGELRYQHHLDQATMIEAEPDTVQRTAEALRIVKELAQEGI